MVSGLAGGINRPLVQAHWRPPHAIDTQTQRQGTDHFFSSLAA
jgi:hypothetical protein